MSNITNTITDNVLTISGGKSSYTIYLDAAHCDTVARTAPWRRGPRCFINNQRLTLFRLLHGDKALIVPESGGVADYRSSNVTEKQRVLTPVSVLNAAQTGARFSGPRTQYHPRTRYKSKNETVVLPIKTQVGLRHVRVNACYAHLVPLEARWSAPTKVRGEFGGTYSDYIYRIATADAMRWSDEAADAASERDGTECIGLRKVLAITAGLQRIETYGEIGDDFTIDHFNARFVRSQHPGAIYHKLTDGSYLMELVLYGKQTFGTRGWVQPDTVTQRYVSPMRYLAKLGNVDRDVQRRAFMLVDADVVDALRAVAWTVDISRDDVRSLGPYANQYPISKTVDRKFLLLQNFIVEAAGLCVYNTVSNMREREYYVRAKQRLQEFGLGTDKGRRAARVVIAYESKTGTDDQRTSAFVSAKRHRNRVITANVITFVPEYADGAGCYARDYRINALTFGRRRELDPEFDAFIAARDKRSV